MAPRDEETTVSPAASGYKDPLESIMTNAKGPKTINKHHLWYIHGKAYGKLLSASDDMSTCVCVFMCEERGKEERGR
jgi:hypothetical protein